MRLSASPIDYLSTAADILAPGGGGSPSGGGGDITVSPAFQQQFTPQISPVFQQTQSSPGSTQTAQPIFTARGGQSARPGVPAPLDYGMPGAGGNGYAFPDAFPEPFPASPIVQQKDNYTPLIIAGILAATVIGGIMLFKKNKRSAPKTSTSSGTRSKRRIVRKTRRSRRG